MKIASAEQIRSWDQFTINKEPVASIDLMERACHAFCNWFKVGVDDRSTPITIFCGTGNNGGDGLGIARLLSQDHYEVEVYLCLVGDRLSPDAQINLERLEASGIKVKRIQADAPLPELASEGVIIDALFGSGLNRPVGGYWAKLLDYLNSLIQIRVAVDIPSGLFADQPSTGTVFWADYTLSFERPKLAFFIPESGKYVGKWEVVPIGLHPDFEPEIHDTFQYLNSQEVALLLHRRGKFDHKGTHGHALIAAGSYGKMGAALLTAKACLRAGAGLTTIHSPKCGYEILQIGFPEAMVLSDSHQFVISDIDSIYPYQAVGIGPGIGVNNLTERALYSVIERCSSPLVIDADGLNILAKHQEWLSELPLQTILTPHPKEFERLVGPAPNDFKRISQLQGLAMESQSVVVLKGGHTAIADPEGRVYFNTTGNPGMGTGGSGDVLTGILTGLLSQGYSNLEAAILGVHLHGLAGDIAAEQLQQESLLASDLIEHLGKAFGHLRAL